MRHVVSGLVALLVLAAAGCEVVGPTNQFDPQTPADQQARGTVVGRVFLDGRDLDALPVQIAMSSMRPSQRRPLFTSGVTFSDADQETASQK